MRKGFLISEEMRKYLVIYEEAFSHIWLCNCSIPNFISAKRGTEMLVAVSGQQEPVLVWKCLHHKGLSTLAAPGQVRTAEDFAATGRVYTTGACAAPGHVYRYWGLSCTWTGKHNRGLTWAALGCIQTTGVCAGLDMFSIVYTEDSWAAPGRVFTIEAFAATIYCSVDVSTLPVP